MFWNACSTLLGLFFVKYEKMFFVMLNTKKSGKMFFFLEVKRVLITCSTAYQPNGQPPISCTDKPITALVQIDGTSAAEYPPPRRLRTDEISQVVNDFRIAAKNAMEAGHSYPN